MAPINLLMSMIYRQQIHLLHVRVKDNRYNYNDPLGNNSMAVVCIDIYFVPIFRQMLGENKSILPP